MSYLTKKLNKRVLVDIKLTPDDWELYNMPEVERIAETLNARFNECVNMSNPRQVTESVMRKELRLYRNWGSDDTEPRMVLEQLLDEVYNDS